MIFLSISNVKDIGGTSSSRYQFEEDYQINGIVHTVTSVMRNLERSLFKVLRVRHRSPEPRLMHYDLISRPTRVRSSTEIPLFQGPDVIAGGYKRVLDIKYTSGTVSAKED